MTNRHIVTVGDIRRAIEGVDDDTPMVAYKDSNNTYYPVFKIDVDIRFATDVYGNQYTNVFEVSVDD